ncbi:MAG: hypothetical protein U1E27_05630 [Kiritimatiellia bacterium]|nr:hypothetical protein [Kiritimatiellia bacterium]
MKNLRFHVGVSMVLALAGGAWTMPEARAGQKEWATAGKILTGVMAAQILLDRHPPTPVYRERVVVTRHSDRRFHGERESYSSRSAHRPYHVEPVRAHCAPRIVEPIILPAGPGRRLYQPPVSGHPALIQEWRCGSWVTVGTHPSLW